MKLSYAQRATLRSINSTDIYLHYASVGTKSRRGGARASTLRVLVDRGLVRNVCMVGDEFIGAFKPYVHVYVITAAGREALR